MSPGCKLRRKRLVTRPEPIACGGFGFSRKSVSRASARRRRCWAIVCELFNVGGSAIAKAAWRRCWRHRSDVARRSASRRRPGRVSGGDAGGSHRREAQLYLRDTWHIAYGIDAISKLFRRRKTKLKTGRPHHRNSPTDQAAFKK